MANIPNVKLNNGVEMPQEGFGVYQIDDLDQCKQSVLDALDVGYRAIDTAQFYHNESAVGDAIEESDVDRKDIFLTSKVWFNRFGYDKAKETVEQSLKYLKTDYLDLVLIHQPFNDYYGAYRALEDLYNDGKIRAIGVSNFYPDRFVDFAKFAKVTPALDQLETHVFRQRNLDKEYLDKYGTKMEAWAPLGEGKTDLFNSDILSKIADNHDKTIAQVALRFLAQRGIMIIPKSTHKERMKENLDVWDFELSDDEMNEIKKLDGGHKVMNHYDPATVEGLIDSTKDA